MIQRPGGAVRKLPPRAGSVCGKWKAQLTLERWNGRSVTFSSWWFFFNCMEPDPDELPIAGNWAGTRRVGADKCTLFMISCKRPQRWLIIVPTGSNGCGVVERNILCMIIKYSLDSSLVRGAIEKRSESFILLSFYFFEPPFNPFVVYSFLPISHPSHGWDGCESGCHLLQMEIQQKITPCFWTIEAHSSLHFKWNMFYEKTIQAKNVPSQLS